MSDQVNKEALFNEVKGSLFEYLVGLKLAQRANQELDFIQNIDKNYLAILGQQDRMVRQFYPEMLSFLNEASTKGQETLCAKYGENWVSIKLLGKLSSSQLQSDFKETDLLLVNEFGEQLLLSLKLNKKSAFVNTKSAGVKSFLTQYFPYLNPSFQNEFSNTIDLEFKVMGDELYRQYDLEFNGNFNEWVKNGYSELPGELAESDRDILKKYYARIAKTLHRILSTAFKENPEAFKKSLYPLMGFSDPRIIQLICFHDFKSQGESVIEIHDFKDVVDEDITIRDFKDIASIEVESSRWVLQIRIKPMNKFTTTAMKVNCAVKFK
ncbi:MAG TPA: hypothetical protein VKY27_00805 [Bacteriovoracaceae bacterium]|nr:hypothetical protein [Bacteriovoracaceae bacterium]